MYSYPQTELVLQAATAVPCNTVTTLLSRETMPLVTWRLHALAGTELCYPKRSRVKPSNGVSGLVPYAKYLAPITSKYWIVRGNIIETGGKWRFISTILKNWSIIRHASKPVYIVTLNRPPSYLQNPQTGRFISKMSEEIWTIYCANQTQPLNTFVYTFNSSRQEMHILIKCSCT
jgi:hypothetical protein